MQPNDPQNPQRAIDIPQRADEPHFSRPDQNTAAANYARAKVQAIYQGQSRELTPHTTPVQVPQHTANNLDQASVQAIENAAVGALNPYQKTHNEHNHHIDQSDWQKYHTAWQQYYQKYYEQYYTAHIKKTQEQVKNHIAEVHKTAEVHIEKAKSLEAELQSQPLSEDEALYNLRSDLLGKVALNAKKVRKSRHFMPVVLGVSVMAAFAFLQWNQVIGGYVAAYVAPSTAKTPEIIVPADANIAVGPESKLIIPRINVDAPIVYGVNPDEKSLLDAMSKGVAHFSIPGANSVPGQIGNTVLSAHSSNDLFEQGDYKFLFARLEQLKVGDTFFINYNKIRYSYTITRTKIVAPTDVQSLIGQDNGKPIVTLITCVPLGTADNRLLLFAEQISPDPAAATPATTSDSSSGGAAIPGNNSSALQKLFGQ